MKKLLSFAFSLFLLVLAGLSFAGETEKIIEFSITGSSTTHPPRTYRVDLSNPTNATIGTGSATLTIQSGSGAQVPTLSMRMIDALVDRGGTVGTVQRFAVDRAGDTSPAVSVNFAVQGTGDTPAVASDFVGDAFPSGNISLAAGETSKVTTLSIAGKAAPSATVSYSITLSSPIGANLGNPTTVIAQVQNSGSGAVVTWSISSPNPTVDRGENGTTQSVDVSRTSSSGAATIDLGTAQGGGNPATAEDFVPPGFPSQTLSFSNLESIKRITWNLAGRAGAGSAVTYDAMITNPSAGDVGSGAVRLTVLDSGPSQIVTLPLRIHAGGTSIFTDAQNNQWGADAFFSGGTAIATASAIAGTTDDGLYARQRTGGPVRYTLAGLPTGQTYDVTLLFAEIDAAQSGSCSVSSNGARKMDFYANNTLIEADIDPCKAVGHLTAYSREYLELTADANGQVILEVRGNPNATILPALAGFHFRIHEEPALPERFFVFGQPEASYVDQAEHIWVNGDQYVTGCNPTNDGELHIAGTNDPELFWGRCNGQTLTISVPIDVSGGTAKTVYLGFSEHEATAAGQRVMDITAEGVTAASGFDILSAAGGGDHAYRLRKDVTVSGGRVDISLVGTGTLPAQVNNLAIYDPTVVPAPSAVMSLGWKSAAILGKNDIVRAFAPPRGLAPSGNALVVRSIDDTASTMHVDNLPCPTSPIRGLKEDTPETNNSLFLCIQTRDPANHANSLFTLNQNESVIDEFSVEVCEIDRATGEEVNCQPFSVGVRVSRAGV